MPSRLGGCTLWVGRDAVVLLCARASHAHARHANSFVVARGWAGELHLLKEAGGWGVW